MARHGAAAIWTTTFLLAGAAMSQELEAQPKDAPASAALGTGTTTGGSSSAGTHYWYDGGRRRPLAMDRQHSARFGAKSSALRAGDVLVPSALAAKDALAAGEALSPVLRDERGRPRALPGGVIVTLPLPASEQDARRRLQALGLTPVRAIGSGWRIWLVAAEPGLASLELANRLQESGAVSAQPNWWEPRATK